MHRKWQFLPALILAGLLDNNFTIGGSAILKTQNNENLELLNQGKENLRKIRGKDITMILQNPMTCFDSLYRVDYQMAETFQAHTNWTKAKIKEKSLEVLEKMQINQARQHCFSRLQYICKSTFHSL